VSNRLRMLIAVPLVALLAWAGTSAVNGKEESKMLPLPATEYAPDKTAKPGETRTAVFAGGCFWCVEGVFEQLEGVKGAVSGYAGGTKETANYKAVCSGLTKHAEAVSVTYDPTKISYGELLQVFFTTHDPTTKDQQGNDIGPQYRSAIFPLDDDQKKIATEYITKLNEIKAFPRPVVTTVEPLKMAEFYVAEDYHQDYAACNPNNPYIRAVAVPKVDKTKEKFADKLKKAEEKK